MMEPMEEQSTSGKFKTIQKIISIRYQRFLDDVTPFPIYRWIFTTICLFIFMTRIFMAQGWYVIAYALGIYLLNIFLAFLTPKFDPTIEDDDDDGDGPSLPTKSDEEFKPFVRRLPEFKFWVLATNSILISFCLTFFEIFDIPVFWPILLFYFIFLFILTMRRQIQHMIKHRYIPFDLGKKKYTRT